MKQLEILTISAMLLHSTVSYRNTTVDDPIECKLYYWLASKDSLGTEMIQHLEHDCMDHFIQTKDVEAFCLNNGDVCLEYKRHYVHKVTPEMNRRILKGTPPVPPPTDSPKPTGSPTRNPTVSPTISPTISPTVSEETISSLFFKYPNGLCFDQTMTGFGPEYSVVDPNTMVLSDYSLVSYKDFTIRNQILTKFRFGPTAYSMFIFEGELLKYIINRETLSHTVDFKIPPLKHTNCTIYERKFRNNEPNVYLTKYFGFTDLTSEGYHRENADQYILLKVEDMNYDESQNMQDLCTQIPRCLGYIPTKGLISSLAKRKHPTLIPIADANINYTYIEKNTRHSIFTFFSRNDTLIITLWTLVMLVCMVLVVFPSVIARARKVVKSKLFKH